MPNHILVTTPHFEIVWWPGVDNRGLYITMRLDADSLSWLDSDAPQCFVDLDLVPALIVELRESDAALPLLSRVTSPFVPHFYRRPKKDGGEPGLAYYTPLSVEGALRGELADALERACSWEDVARLEERNSSESYSVLDNRFLENGVWRSTSTFPGAGEWLSRTPSNAIEIPAHQLALAPKHRFRAPTGNIYGDGTTVLRVAGAKHRCWKSRCLEYVWIKPGISYIEQRRAKGAFRFHIKCAFREGIIPVRWLSPHFEQHHLLVELGFVGWLDREREKVPPLDLEKALASLNPPRVEEFVELMKSGYELDSSERSDWREFLHHVPFDIEPFGTARKLVGLPDPSKPNAMRTGSGFCSPLGAGEPTMANKTTSKKAATAASKTMQDRRTGDDSKSAAGSALSQAAKTPAKSTGDAAASSASEVLQSEDTGAKSKTAAASALSQAKGGKGKKS